MRWLIASPSSTCALRVQALIATGAIMSVCQLAVFPPLIKTVGTLRWQRFGCVVGIPALIAVPSAKLLSWDDTSLYIFLVANDAVVYSSLQAVRQTNP